MVGKKLEQMLRDELRKAERFSPVLPICVIWVLF